jgi:hypothetical protein
MILNSISASQLHILQHSLGLDRYGEGRQFRNHFCTGPGCTDYEDCMAMVDYGLMRLCDHRVIYGGDSAFQVTHGGIEYVALHSPKRPSEKKMTRSQKRYWQYLRTDCNESFGEWLKNGWYR